MLIADGPLTPEEVEAAQELRIFPYHLKKARFCMKGVRAWAALHGLDHLAFVRDGVPAPLIIATGDSYANRCVRIAIEEALIG